jgi:hypothetical protein
MNSHLMLSAEGFGAYLVPENYIKVISYLTSLYLKPKKPFANSLIADSPDSRSLSDVLTDLRLTRQQDRITILQVAMNSL